MFKKIILSIISFVLVFLFSNTYAKPIELNTNFPGIGKTIDPLTAGDSLGGGMGALMRLMINITVAVAFISIIAAGVMMTLSGVSQGAGGKGKELLKKVILGIILLGLSGIILHTINPNFFKTGITTQLILHI